MLSRKREILSLLSTNNRNFAEGFDRFNETERDSNSVSPFVSCFCVKTQEENIPTRVPFGELVWFAEFPPTLWLTQNAESESSRRFVFSDYLATTCDVSRRGESSLPTGSERGQPDSWPHIRPNSLTLCPRGRFWLTTWLRSDPGRNPSRMMTVIAK